MRVSSGVRGLCAAGLLLAASFCSPAFAEETVAIEVVPATGSAEDPDSETAESLALEVTLLEQFSLRQVGPPPVPLEDGSAAAALGMLAGPQGSSDNLIGASLGGESSDSTLDILYENRAFEDLRRRELGEEPPMPALPARAPTRGSARSGWVIDGSITMATGSATYADADNLGFVLRESLDLLSGDHYEFYQIYEVDQSFVNSSLLTLGARQRLRDWAWGGDLRLTEEFRLYRDRDNSDFDRQEGLFALRFDPEWLCGRLDADFNYKYRVRVYETFSSRSYIQHYGRTELTYRFSPRLATRGLARYDNYNYSEGSTYSNKRLAVGNEWEWEVADGLELSAGVARERKQYQDDETRTYEKQGFEAGADWDIDADSSLRVRGELVDYDRELRPESSYEDASLNVRYRRNLSDQVDAELRLLERDKDYDLGTTYDLGQHGVDFRLNFNPNWDWNIYAGLGQTQYDYKNTSRAFDRQDAGVGVSYYMSQLRASADYFRREYSFDVDVDRDYTLDDFNCYLDYRFDLQRWRVYYGISLLSQADPASVNEYDETRLGAAWDYELDPCVDLRLSYEYNIRNYDAYDDIEYGQLEARLEFEL